MCETPDYMKQLIEAGIAAIPIIQDIAYRTWPEAFRNILSAAQIQYMLDRMYSPISLQEQMTILGHHFLLAEEEAGNYSGVISFEHRYRQLPQTKIHKIYILPAAQGKGTGKLLIGAVEQHARQQGDQALLLNVNKHNDAALFYQRLGFSLIGYEDIDIGQGFLMEDKIMQKELPTG